MASTKKLFSKGKQTWGMQTEKNHQEKILCSFLYVSAWITMVLGCQLIPPEWDENKLPDIACGYQLFWCDLIPTADQKKMFGKHSNNSFALHTWCFVLLAVRFWFYVLFFYKKNTVPNRKHRQSLNSPSSQLGCTSTQALVWGQVIYLSHFYLSLSQNSTSPWSLQKLCQFRKLQPVYKKEAAGFTSVQRSKRSFQERCLFFWSFAPTGSLSCNILMFNLIFLIGDRRFLPDCFPFVFPCAKCLRLAERKKCFTQEWQDWDNWVFSNPGQSASEWTCRDQKVLEGQGKMSVLALFGPIVVLCRCQRRWNKNEEKRIAWIRKQNPENFWRLKCHTG